ncbi:MAG TPA: sigma factor [Chthonomonadaceae bacterium]|nr:sigma factor [Chthonomonadaceae bacterium]
MTLDEKNLARRFRAGEAGSFETLYHGTRIYRFSQGLCGNDACAEDLTQDVFLAAYRGAERFEGRSSLATWLYRIALYRWRNIRNVQPKVLEKLSTPQQRKEDAKWRAEQQALMDAWFRSQDERTQQRLGSSLIGSGTH